MSRLSDRTLKIILWSLLALAIFFLGSAFYIPVKAMLAQTMLENAWNRTLANKQAYKPWSWSDTYPTARLRAPAHGIDQIVVDGDQGNSLAFAPGIHPASEVSKRTGMIVISAHRDTHFHFLKDVQLGEILELQTSDGEITQYRIEDVQVVHADQSRIISPDDSKWLALVTCYPFNTVRSDPSLRFVVMAEAINLKNHSIISM